MVMPDSLSMRQVYEWSRKFHSGLNSVSDSPRPGKAHQVEKPEVAAEIKGFVMENL